MWENELHEQSAVNVLVVTNKMASKRACGHDSTATPTVSKFFRKISGMYT